MAFSHPVTDRGRIHKAGHLGRRVAAAALAMAVLVGCSSNDGPPSAEDLRTDLSKRIDQQGAEGIAKLTLTSTGSSSVTTSKSGTLTTFGAVWGEGSEQNEDRHTYGHAPLASFPIDQVVAAAKDTTADCESQAAGSMANASLEVAPRGTFILNRLCDNLSGKNLVVEQKVDGKALTELGPIDSEQTLKQVIDEYTALQKNSAKTIGIKIDYGPGVLGPVAPAIRVLGPKITNSGTPCFPGVKHTQTKGEYTDPGTGLTLPCEATGIRDDDINPIFDLKAAPANKIAAVLAKIHREVPRDAIRNATIFKSPKGPIVVQVQGKDVTKSYTIDGSEAGS